MRFGVLNHCDITGGYSNLHYATAMLLRYATALCYCAMLSVKTLNFRSLKLSSVEPSQYLDG